MSARPADGLKVGVWLSKLRPEYFVEVAREAERLGYESLWISEHLILPAASATSPGAAGEAHASISPATPTFDALGYLSYLAGMTSEIRLGTWIYLLGLRHPFVSARAVQTLDLVSNGRVELGIGAGWLAGEWQATELDFDTRGRRMVESLEVCRRLWREDTVEHHGTFFDFGPVGFEPKPVQQPSPPVHLGGESDVALTRAAALGDGWIGMQHTPASARSMVDRLTALGAPIGRAENPFQVTVGGSIETHADRAAWEASGVTRLIVSPWNRSQEALDGLQRLAAQLGLVPRPSAA
jgi:probable F420-dependent oxidoreductase